MNGCCCPDYPHTKHVITIAPDEHYDYESAEICSHENILREKFIGLALVKLWFFAPAQILYRLYDVTQGGFYVRGYENAKHEARKTRELVSCCNITCSVLLELIKDVGRIILFPLYLLALVFSCTIGVFCVELGRRIFSRVDQLFYVHPIDPDTYSAFEQWTNLAAPCMQTKEFRKEMNLFRYAGLANLYHPHTLHALHNRLQKLIAKASDYFILNDLRPLRMALTGRASLQAALRGTKDGLEARGLAAGQNTNRIERERLCSAITHIEAAINDNSLQANLHIASAAEAISNGDPTPPNFNQPFTVRV